MFLGVYDKGIALHTYFKNMHFLFIIDDYHWQNVFKNGLCRLWSLVKGY